jgi:hypothetical protein
MESRLNWNRFCENLVWWVARKLPKQIKIAVITEAASDYGWAHPQQEMPAITVIQLLEQIDG